MSTDGGDDWTQQMLDKWILAKRQKDFATADQIRDVLRGMGIDPDTVRPRGWSGDASGGKAMMGNTGNASNSMENSMNQMMQMMTQMMGMISGNTQMAGLADSNPTKKQKVSGMPSSGAAQSVPQDEWTQQQLDKWLVAKRCKDFVTADAIRDELRATGIDPDTVRPKGWAESNMTGASGAGSGKTGDPWTDEQLDKWLAAKRSKDFVTADAIRDELRTMGVDPDTVRPPGWEVKANGGKTGDPWMDEQLDKWLIAKRQKDFATADAIRDELRAMGVDPDTVRPRGWELQAGGGSTGDPWTEQQLDKWLSAKRQGDFATADAIRSELRAMGVDPDTLRPPGWQPPADGGCSGLGKSSGKGSMGNVGNTLNAPDNNQMQMMQMMSQMMGMMGQNM